MRTMISVIKATTSHIDQLAVLFDQYRVFYKQASDLRAATEFLDERFLKNESVVFMAYLDEEAVGFTQLYTSFSSVSMQAIYVLNDLFVSPAHRKKGIGAALLNKAKAHCKQMRFKGLALETAVDNPAQELYERLGWKKDVQCFHYFWTA